MSALLEGTPGDVAAALRRDAHGRACFVRDPGGSVRSSHPALQPVADAIARLGDYADHEAVFLAVGPETGALFGAFVHCTNRGQAQGGLRHWPYADFAAFLRDGLRLAQGMGRKCALAGLWWGGGKGLIARQPEQDGRDPSYRERLYAEYGRFVTSLRGCYITAEDAGTTPRDMAVIHQNTRFATCIPPDVGGSGNPSAMTAEGVVCAMRAALAFSGAGPLAGKRIAMQGAGNVGTFMIEQLLGEGVDEILVSETCPERRDLLLDRFSDRSIVVETVDPDDHSILAAPCDVLVPNALGGVLNDKTIPSIQAGVVCGAANNQLAEENRHGRALFERGIVHVPDFVANRMGIVACSNEHAGHLPNDPSVRQQLDDTWPGGIHQTTLRLLERARDEGTTPTCAANGMADARAREPHPLFGGRPAQIIEALHAEYRQDETPA